MTDAISQRSRGLLNSLTTLVGTLLNIVHTRLDLLLVDVEEYGQFYLSLLLLGMAGLFCLGVAVILLSILVVVIFWDTHRLLALASLAGFFIVCCIGIAAWVMQKIAAKPKLLAASLAELQKDRQHIHTVDVA